MLFTKTILAVAAMLGLAGLAAAAPASSKQKVRICAYSGFGAGCPKGYHCDHDSGGVGTIVGFCKPNQDDVNQEDFNQDDGN